MLRCKHIYDYITLANSDNNVLMVITDHGIRYVQKTYTRGKVDPNFICQYCSRRMDKRIAYFAYDYNASRKQVCCGRCFRMITRMFDHIAGKAKFTPSLGKLEYINNKIYRRALHNLCVDIRIKMYLCREIYPRDVASIIGPIIAKMIAAENRCSWEDFHAA